MFSLDNLVYHRMANNQRNNDFVIGQITNVSNKNNNKKFFVKFTLITSKHQIIDGWIFNSTSGILSTESRQALTHTLKTKSGIKLWDFLEQNESTYIYLINIITVHSSDCLNH